MLSHCGWRSLPIGGDIFSIGRHFLGQILTAPEVLPVVAQQPDAVRMSSALQGTAINITLSFVKVSTHSRPGHASPRENPMLDEGGRSF
jgi:hypothetical protein